MIISIIDILKNQGDVEVDEDIVFVSGVMDDQIKSQF
jgi:hypothetical protein